MSNDDEQRQLEQTREALVDEFQGRLSRDEVAERFAEIERGFASAPVRTFLPLLVLRAAREELRGAIR